MTTCAFCGNELTTGDPPHATTCRSCAAINHLKSVEVEFDIQLNSARQSCAQVEAERDAAIDRAEKAEKQVRTQIQLREAARLEAVQDRGRAEKAEAEADKWLATSKSLKTELLGRSGCCVQCERLAQQRDEAVALLRESWPMISATPTWEKRTHALLAEIDKEALRGEAKL